jgi:Hypervirulence associated proteins TUDOR domain
MGSDFKSGDKVRWNTPQGETHGVVQRKETKKVMVGGTKLDGSEDDPVYIVKSDKTGKEAGHKAGALKRAS